MGPVLDVRYISKKFREGGGQYLKVLRQVSLTVNEGECCALVGESGCGKSTLARIITGLIPPDEGSVILCGEEISSLHGASLRRVRRHIKMIFQEPRSSFDPRLTIGQSLDEALKVVMPDRHARREEAGRLMTMAGLAESFLSLYPSEISGGECQRAAIARALAQKPRLLICDEATSALDVLSQARITALLKQLCQQQKMAILFISHDLALVNQLCSRLYVMREGEIIEEGSTERVISAPSEVYTQRLLDSVIVPETAGH